MSGQDSATRIVGSTIVAGSGVAVLPATNGNIVGNILAITAITVGVSALTSQLVVRVMKRRYQ